MKNLLTSLVLTCLGTALYAQPLPNTNIFLFDFKQDGDNFELSRPKFLTAFNQEGYNNQPSFMGSNQLLITVGTPDQPQTDIYILDLLKREKTRFTATSESEYSPMIAPRDYKNPNQTDIACVRVEVDAKTQLLWQYPFDRTHTGKNSLPEDITNVGYYNWVNPRQVALFLVDEPHELVLYDNLTEEFFPIAQGVGRCIKTLNNYQDFAFVTKTSDGDWILKRFDTQTQETKLITAMLKGVEDFAILKDETFITAQGSKIYKFNIQQDVSWKEIADLSEFEINNITRITIDPNEQKLAIVVKE